MKNYLDELSNWRRKSRAAFLLVLGLFISGLATAQERTVSGTVQDADDQFGLPGVTILVKGTGTGTTTDFNGNYQLNVSDNDVLVFSFVGYTTQEIAVGAQSVIDVTMSLNVEELEEIVVVGYGTVEKGDVTGVVSTIGEEEFNTGMLTSPDQLISGKVAGVTISSNSGEPGAQVSVRIRGGTSIQFNNEPLYVIDGVPIDNSPHNPGGFSSGRNPLNFINPNDIESMTVLKDASAAAIYGSRGANGVIIITTKSGSQGGEPTVTYDGSFGFSQFVSEVDNLSPSNFRKAVEIYGSRNEDKLGDAETVWFDEIIQTATSQSHNLALSSGIENGSYRLSLGYQDINGVLLNSSNERTSLGFNMNKTMLDDALTFRFNTKNSFTDDVYASNQVGSALTFDPTQPVYDANSQYGGYFEYDDPLGVRNPVAEIMENEEIGNSFRSISNIELRYTLPFFDALTLVTNLSYDQNSGERRAFSPSYLRSQDPNGGRFNVESFNRRSSLGEFYAEYNTTIADEFDLTVLGGYSYQNFINSYNYFSVDSLTTDLYGIDAPAVGSGSLIQPGYTTLENRLISFYGRANVSAYDKYVLTATLRRDGSTRFGEENRWGWFPSFAAGWRITNEDFMAGVTHVMNYLKFRVGYGITGNQEIADYLYIPTYGYSDGQAQYQFGNTYYPILRPKGVDPALKWEETASFNIGFDYEFFSGKLAGSIEFYQKVTNDLLNEVPIPAGSGVTDKWITNIGQVNNSGVELVLSVPIIRNDNINWNVSFNAAYNQNEIKRLDYSDLPDSVTIRYENTRSGISGDVGQTIQVWEVGQPANTFFTYEQLYAEGAPIYNPNDRTQMYRDLNGDGRINEDDLRPLHSPAPDFIFGLTSTFNYRAFDVSFTVRSHVGNYVYNNISSAGGYFERLNGTLPYNIHESVFKTNFFERQLKSDYYLENASFVKLDNLTLGYSLNQLNWTKARFYVTGQNLLTITGYSGMDPEIPNGIDNNLYPRSITIIGGVNLTF